MKIKVRVIHKIKSHNAIIFEKDFKSNDEAIEHVKKHLHERFGFKSEMYDFDIVN